MTSDCLKLYLEHLYQYNCLVFTDLATELTTPTALFKTVESVYKPSFDSNERLVFYTSHYPSDATLAHLHRCMELLNIGGFFCVLCCPHDIKHRVNQYRDPVTTVQISMNTTEVLLDSFNVPDTFCPLPWMHLEVKHNGDIYPCCVYESPVASATNSTLADTLTGGAMSLLRQEFMQGHKPSGCGHCWRLEDQNLKSNRQWHVGYNSKKFYSEYFDDIKIRSLDIKPGNVCNFKCRICNPTSSSLFADEARDVIAIKTGRWVEYNDYTWNELATLLPNIENLDFYGGEPFLIKQIPKLLEYAVEHGYAPKIRLHINSNGSIFPDALIPILLKFKEVDIALSIDNIGARFELERGGTWDDVAGNILKFNKLNCMYLMPTVNIQNVYYIDELLSWADAHRIRVTLNFLDAPNWANIDNMTPQAKQLVFDKFKNSLDPNLKSIANRVHNSVGSNGAEFVKQMKRFDLIRNQNFAETHSAIALAMGY